VAPPFGGGAVLQGLGPCAPPLWTAQPVNNSGGRPWSREVLGWRREGVREGP
jgi:hypothetical protein